MKSLKISSIIAVVVVLLSNLTALAMEAPKKEYFFIKTAISDIQDFAEDKSQETGKKYQIITQPVLVEACLQVLGLNENNTPLDVRYHYELLKQKLLKDPLHSTVEKAYTQLIKMFFVFDGYQNEISDLLAMNFIKMEEMELEETSAQPYEFAKYKNKVIDQTIKELQQRNRQYIFNEPIESSSTIKKLLNLPSHASANSITRHYNSYIEKNSPNQLIARKNMNKISSQDLKDKMFEIEKIKEAYTQYLKEK